ncbi:P-type conjugative transfer protein VirB9 (plasmid) [Agrobacterium sp. rho-13.3]|uniref:P-type conjugative transfer protein VirB9 n=1 Tax=Agrobacterium sp. rho-13.3 TaxID=3072980 RepID=UPI002A1172AA|nr:P-type conjugative transfer protein VirB9 [Agrobacterium sp. rho-13.3]MDX8311525.1 P-type conjugative transfer protein VirB9 [Agrobacterium sp. rho-13.3]
MKAFVLAAVMAFAMTGTAFAVDVPTGSRYDARIQYVNYNAGDVVLVRTLPGLGSRIVFAPGEQVVSGASGFTEGWEFKAAGNMLFIKPKSVKISDTEVLRPESGKWNTNLMVTTTLRIYDFDLQLLPGDSSGEPAKNQAAAYRVEFRYPGEERAKAEAEARTREVDNRLSAKASPVNWHYTMQVGKKSSGIAPSLAYDDGRFTYIRFPGNRDFPTVYIVADDGSESIIDTHVDPAATDILVVHRVAKSLVLRLGQSVVGIYNERFDPQGRPAEDGTTVPGVKRTIIAEEAK